MKKRLGWFKHWSNAGSGETLMKIQAEFGLQGEGFFWRVMQLIARFENREENPGCIEIPLSMLTRDVACSVPKTLKLLCGISRIAGWEVSFPDAERSKEIFQFFSQISSKTCASFVQDASKMSPRYVQDAGKTLKIFVPKWLLFQETGWQKQERISTEDRSKKKEVRREIKKEAKSGIEIPNPPQSSFKEPAAPVRAPTGAPPNFEQDYFLELPDFDRAEMPAEQAPRAKHDSTDGPGLVAAPKNLPTMREKQKLAVSTNQALSSYAGAYRKRYGSDPPVSGKMRGQLRTLAKDHGAEKAVKLLAAYLAMSTDFFVDRKHDVGTLLLNLNHVAHFLETGELPKGNKNKLFVEHRRDRDLEILRKIDRGL